MIACLGRDNYWTTLPFLSAIAIAAALGVMFPRWLRGWPDRMWLRRLMAAGLFLVIVAVAIPSALREAQNNPDCTPSAA